MLFFVALFILALLRPTGPRSTAELLVKCCPRKLDHIEIDPNRPMPPTDLAESLDAFSRSDIIRALRGHPGCVVDFSKLVGEAERSLFLERERWVDVEIPKVGGRAHMFGCPMSGLCFFEGTIYETIPGALDILCLADILYPPHLKRVHLTGL